MNWKNKLAMSDKKSDEKFHGFPEEGLKFLKQLKRHNTREWFQPRKEKYNELLKEPMLLLIEDLNRHFSKIAPEVRFTPRSILRVYRDTRFSKDKTPHKTAIAASFTLGGFKKVVDAPGFYLSVSPDRVMFGGGLYRPDARQLNRIRYAIDQKPDEFLSLIDDRKFKSMFGTIQGETLKRAPKGYLPDNAMIEHLKRKEFFAFHNLKIEACLKPSFTKQVAEGYERLLPLTRWLRDNSY